MANLNRNERLKVIATWANQLATAILTVGVFSPLAAKIYGVGPEPKNQDLLTSVWIVCICLAIFLHLCSHGALEFNVDTEDAEAAEVPNE